MKLADPANYLRFQKFNLKEQGKLTDCFKRWG